MYTDYADQLISEFQVGIEVKCVRRGLFNKSGKTSFSGLWGEGRQILWEWEKQRRRRAFKLFFLRFQGEINAPDARVAEELRQLSEPELDRGCKLGDTRETPPSVSTRAFP